MEPSGEDRVGGRYELVRRIARGGGGTVWHAFDHLLDREVAVKHVIIGGGLPHDPAGEAERARSRVRSEARAAARLGHPGAVGIYDVIDDGEDVFLVLEYVPWETLDEVVARRGPFDDVEVARLGLGLLQVLEAAHLTGIVHRDVKPSNVFVAPPESLAAAPDVVVKLSDFGIASIEGDTRLTRTGAAVGSPAYIAPEQASGRAAAPAVDLWGLGASLYHAVEGVPPFERSTAVATVHAVVHDPPRTCERAEALAPLLGELLAKEPQDRPGPDHIRTVLREVAGPSSPPDLAATPPVVLPVRSGTAPADAPPVEPSVPAEPAASSASAGTSAVEDATGEGARPGEVDGTDRHAADDPRRASRGGRRGPALLLAGVVALALLVGGAAVLTDVDGPETDPDGVAGGASDTDDEAGQDATDPVGEAGGDQTGSDDDGADGDGPGDDTFGPAIETTSPPEDWTEVDGATYQLAIPAGWEVEPGQGNLVDHRDPSTGAYLRVDWTDEPEDDPVANWERFESDFAANQADYDRIELRPATFQGSEAAYWEYTYTAGGTELRAINLNVRVDDGRAYALNLQSPASAWDETVARFPALAGGFAHDRD